MQPQVQAFQLPSSFSGLLPRSPLIHSSLLLRLLGLLLVPLRLFLSPFLQPLQYALSILINLQLCDDDFARRNPYRHALAIALLFRDTLDVDHIFQTVDGRDFTVATLIRTADDGNFVVFAYGDGAHLLEREKQEGISWGILKMRWLQNHVRRKSLRRVFSNLFLGLGLHCAFPGALC